jgi:prepilin-type N-terminal cleavage/methylation domain-containing protein
MKPLARKGFTLTELLVVTAILMSLFGLVLSGARTSGRTDGDIRRGAQQFASLLLASQSLSLGSPTGAAVIIDPDGSLSETVAQARRFPFIEGVVVQGMPPADPSASSVSVRLSPTNDDVAALVHGYKIRFFERAVGTDGPVSDWFSLACAAPPQAVVSMRRENGQSSQTALWPTQPTSGVLSFQVARYPIPAGLSQALPAGVAIDLRHSGYGDETMSDWRSLAGKGAIAVGFDPVGTVDALMQNVLPQGGQSRTVQPLTPSEQIYFLITFRDEIEDPTVNTLASDRAMWVVVQPRTGRVTIAENVPQTNTDVAALRAARAKAREGVGIGG